MTELIPAIDIIDGRCVRLSRGDYSTSKIYGDPAEMARAFADAGAPKLHLVDLDGAKASAPCNLNTLERIASDGRLRIEWGGGLKNETALSDCFSAGADFAIIGSVAALQPEVFLEWLDRFGGDRLIFGADVKDGSLAVKGWLEEAAAGMDTLLELFSTHGLARVICTDISRDGMLCGPDISFYMSMAKRFPSLQFTVSGGIGDSGDLAAVRDAGLPGVIVGKAFYEGRITMDEMKLWWQKG